MDDYQYTLEDMLDIANTYTAGQLEEVLIMKNHSQQSGEDIARKSGVSIEYLRWIYLGEHNNEIVDREIAERILQVL